MHHTSDFAQQIPPQTPAAISLNLPPAMEEVLPISFTLSMNMSKGHDVWF